MKDFRIIIDLGHSDVKVALFTQVQMLSSVRFSIENLPDAIDYIEEHLIGYTRIVGLGWVNYSKYGELLADLPSGWRFRVIDLSKYKTEYISLKYEPPESLGLDRISNALAALERFPPPVIVCDIGTAITMDLITENGFEGGFILPGPKLVADAYQIATSQRVIFKLPEDIPTQIPHTTQDALSTGAVFSVLGGINLALEVLKSENECDNLIFTGGWAGKFNGFFKESIVIPHLTLEGYNQMLSWHLDNEESS